MTFNEGGKLPILQPSGRKNFMEGKKMKRISGRSSSQLCWPLGWAATSIVSAESRSPEGVKSAKTIFDVRVANPKAAAIQLKLIHQTYQQLVAENKQPSVSFPSWVLRSS
jgi:hypothetical protein